MDFMFLLGLGFVNFPRKLSVLTGDIKNKVSNDSLRGSSCILRLFLTLIESSPMPIKYYNGHKWEISPHSTLSLLQSQWQSFPKTVMGKGERASLLPVSQKHCFEPLGSSSPLLLWVSHIYVHDPQQISAKGSENRFHELTLWARGTCFRNAVGNSLFISIDTKMHLKECNVHSSWKHLKKDK